MVERFFGDGVSVEEMARRLRCTRCRYKGAGVTALIRVRR